jgi:hypothetical protein
VALAGLGGASAPAVDRGLLPRPFDTGALFEGRDLGGMLEGQADVVEAFEQPDTVGRRNLEADVRPADAP